MICDDVIIVLHSGLWSSLKCAYETDSLPQSKSRGRGSVHINFPRPLHEVERTSKWQRGSPEGKCFRCLKVEWNAAREDSWWPVFFFSFLAARAGVFMPLGLKYGCCP